MEGRACELTSWLDIMQEHESLFGHTNGAVYVETAVSIRICICRCVRDGVGPGPMVSSPSLTLKLCFRRFHQHSHESWKPFRQWLFSDYEINQTHITPLAIMRLCLTPAQCSCSMPERECNAMRRKCMEIPVCQCSFASSVQAKGQVTRTNGAAIARTEP